MVLQSPERVTTLIKDAAEQFVMPRYKMLADHEVQQKAPGDLVTVADIETEEFLSRYLPDLLPGSVVVGEEAYSRDPDVLDHLENYDAVWLVDPVDGTVNFSKGSEVFCVMVALVHKGETVHSWIYVPLEETAAQAELGGGAWYGDNRLQVPEPGSTPWLGQVNLSLFEKDKRDAVKSTMQSFGDLVRLGCAGQDFLMQAQGRRQFALYRRLWSWDHVPGVLLLREAGGIVERIDGGEYRTSDRVEGLLSAPNEHIWQTIANKVVAAKNEEGNH